MKKTIIYIIIIILILVVLGIYNFYIYLPQQERIRVEKLNNMIEMEKQLMQEEMIE